MSSQIFDADRDRSSDLVPEDFDLYHALKKHSETDIEGRGHCPECHKMSYYNRSSKRVGDEFEHQYRCQKCGHTFDEPIPHEEATEWR